MKQDLCFEEPPRIASRSDALELPDRIIRSEGTQGINYALEALRDAIEREVI